MKYVHFTEKDETTGKTRVVSVDPFAVDMVFQSFDDQTKTAIVVLGQVYP